jgi:hypothetical protein
MRGRESCGPSPRGSFSRTRYIREFFLGHLTFCPDVSLGAHGDDRGQTHERVFGSVNTSSGVKILDEEDLECGFRYVDPESVRSSDEGWRRDVDSIENVVLSCLGGGVSSDRCTKGRKDENLLVCRL